MEVVYDDQNENSHPDTKQIRVRTFPCRPVFYDGSQEGAARNVIPSYLAGLDRDECAQSVTTVVHIDTVERETASIKCPKQDLNALG